MRKHKRLVHDLTRGVPKYKCSYCSELFSAKRELWKHIRYNHPEEINYSPNYHERGHKYGEYYCKYCGKYSSALSSLHDHENHCKLNPNRVEYKERPPISEDTRKKISDSMKLAQKEGRAHNIGSDRWKGLPSYPESWFIKMMKSEFSLELNKDYVRELPFHKYSLDFAFPNHKFCVEIDGGQHELDYQRRSDENKDRMLAEEGWDEIRYKWKDIFNNPRIFIDMIKDKLLYYNIISNK